MELKKLNKILEKTFHGKVMAREERDLLILEGELSSWNDIISACKLGAKGKTHLGVLNDIRFTGGEIPKMRLPKFSDTTLSGNHYDVVIVGAGITGSSIARELSRWNLKILLIDKESDVATHASSRNDGEIHPGIDLKKGTLKAKYLVAGNKMYDTLKEELNIPFTRCGQVIAMKMPFSKLLAKIYVAKKVKDLNLENVKVVTKKQLRELEPSLDPSYKTAIYAGSAGITCPYGVTIAYCENAISNGVKVSLDTAVLSMNVENNQITKIQTNRGEITTALLINSAGVFAEEVAKMAHDRFYSIHPRKGTNSILDKKAKWIINSIAAPHTKKNKSQKNTKGGGVLSTVDGNVLVGPNAVETFEKENFATDKESIAEVFSRQKLLSKNLKESDIITYFTGIRAPTFEEDFVISMGKFTKNILHVAGIQSPGLTTAPAVAVDVAKMATAYLSTFQNVEKNPNFNPKRKGYTNTKEMTFEERDALIKKDPSYGEILCRCEEISKGEVLEALRSPLKVPTIDGVKRRVRAGMGRCQGGFCSPLILKTIAEETGKSIFEITKSGAGSEVLTDGTKEGL